MSTARRVGQIRVALTIAAFAAFGGGHKLFAQWSPGTNVTQGLNSMFGSVQYGGAPSTMPPAAQESSTTRGPLARLIQTPDTSTGLPPFALTDQQGAIQRYVEPVHGVDLAAHVGQIVVVRHDTGRTLLASQLDLPSQPLTPLIGEVGAMAAAESSSAVPESISIPASNTARLVEYVDDDDATVQLLSDEEVASPSRQMAAPLEEIPGPMTRPDSPFPAYPDEMIGAGVPGSCCDSAGCDPGGMDDYPGETLGMQPCLRCGRFHRGSSDGSNLSQQSAQAQLYGGVEFLFLRAHASTPFGNLSDNYEFSPRFTLGFDGAGNLGARVRYWHFDRNEDTSNGLQLKLNVLDLECTHSIEGRRSALVLAAGARLASLEITEPNVGQGDCDLLGLTMAADGGIALCCCQGGQVGWVYGGRLSILRGDWDGKNQFAVLQGQDDNVLVDELYVGLQYDSPNPHMNLHARIAFEMQNWRSDVLPQNVAIESISFMGPGLEIGAEF